MFMSGWAGKKDIVGGGRETNQLQALIYFHAALWVA